MNSATSFQRSLEKIAAEKDMANELWINGELTMEECRQKLDVLWEKERDLWYNSYFEAGWKEGEASAKKGLSSKQLICYLIGVFLFGFFISPVLYPKLFGYKSAEECVLAKGSNRVALAMCFKLYRSANDR